MRVGVLDIGSNSAQFLVVDASVRAPPLPIRAMKEPVALGDDVDQSGVISEPESLASSSRVVEADTALPLRSFTVPPIKTPTTLAVVGS
ncbi:hypothetical protein [Nocardia noduli]|uniref:hypothetical protein n=1 Tax=Nocardia noduli TaxID=2815722 RepID=UPI001C23BBA4|nr:hypothetical protein [Nocardia noduli]